VYNKWLDMYKSKLKTLDEAAAMIKDGEDVYCALGGGQPFGMFEAIGQRIRRGELAEVSLFAGNVIIPTALTDPDIKDRVHFDTPFVGPYTRQGNKEGFYTYSPIKLSDMDSISRSTARAEPAGTRHLSAAIKMSEFRCRISCFKTPWAVATSSDLRLLLHTNSPR
jgi:acyl-CoA hydrolase